MVFDTRIIFIPLIATRTRTNLIISCLYSYFITSSDLLSWRKFLYVFENQADSFHPNVRKHQSNKAFFLIYFQKTKIRLNRYAFKYIILWCLLEISKLNNVDNILNHYWYQIQRIMKMYNNDIVPLIHNNSQRKSNL